MSFNRRPNTQDISWFLDLERNGQLNLDPPYQRRSVWSSKDRRFFLDTIFRDYPSPAIFLHKEISEGMTTYAVVDGKQRLSTIIEFTQDRISMPKDFGDSRLDGKKWKSIKKDPSLARRFWDYILPVEMIDIVQGSTTLNEVFDRLNRNSRRLVRQEMRHAKYEGWFLDFVEHEADQSLDWQGLGVVTPARAKRMADVQFLSELLIVCLKGKVGGFDQDEIDDFCARYEDITSPDLDLVVDEDEIRAKFARAKEYLMELEECDHLVSSYAKDFTNLYTLWSVVTLSHENLPSPSEFAAKYKAFMDEVARFKDKDYLARVLSGAEKPSSTESLDYYQNSVGASTEGPQREARYAVLASIVLPRQ